VCSLFKSDPLLKDLPFEKYHRLASATSIEKTQQALESKKHKVTVVDTKEQALEVLKATIPKGASVMNGGSTTLGEIGFIEYLKNATDYDNLHVKVFAETDWAKQAELRRLALSADYFISSVSGVAETGEFMVCDLTGTRTGAFCGSAKNLIIVVGANKIVPTLHDLAERQEKFCLPLESARARIVYKVPGSMINNSVTISGSNPFAAPGRFHIIIVKESLGF